MNPEKAEFKRLIELMEWSQSEAARRLHKTPSAINHLVNPDHSNKPTQTTLQLLKLIMASERPDLFDEAFKPGDDMPVRPKPEPARLNPREKRLIDMFRRAAPGDQQTVYNVVTAMLNRAGGKKRRN
jgi:hypothetical protein